MSDRRRDQEPEEDDEWLFDSIVGYLSSPLWKNPIEHFLEQNCTIFSPEDGSLNSLKTSEDSDEENIIPAEYLEAHIKYKNLVDALINSFLQDIGVTYKQFIRACKNSSHFTNQPVYLELFEQIWATENINIFKSQMIKKNVELELQALILLQFQLGMSKEKKSSNSQKIPDDDEILAVVIRKSKNEYENAKSSHSASHSEYVEPSRTDIETAKQIVNDYAVIEKSLQKEIDQQAYLNRKIVKYEMKNPNQIEEQTRPVSAAKRPGSSRKNLNPQMDKLSLSENAQAANNLSTTYLSTNSTTEVELKRRAEFMEKQRALLTEKKRAERQTQLDHYLSQNSNDSHRSHANNSPMQARPMSSRAARSLLKGVDSSQLPQSTLNTKSVSDEDRKRAEARRALADTLKKEVINQSKR